MVPVLKQKQMACLFQPKSSPHFEIVPGLTAPGGCPEGAPPRNPSFRHQNHIEKTTKKINVITSSGISPEPWRSELLRHLLDPEGICRDMPLPLDSLPLAFVLNDHPCVHDDRAVFGDHNRIEVHLPYVPSLGQTGNLEKKPGQGLLVHGGNTPKTL